MNDAELQDLELTAVELARLAGAEIVTALSLPYAVRYKQGQDATAEQFRDPVSEIDRNAELLIRARLAERHPAHDILGEELDERPALGHEFVWAIDPIDGTANFVNGFPLFAASIGLLHRGVPIVGAVWCAATHTLHPGVYHARRGNSLCFDGQPLQPRSNAQLRRHLAGEPHARAASALPWDVRQTGSCAIECAFVAAGILRVARFEAPNVWDVAGGIPLVLAAGGSVLQRQQGDWQHMQGFDATDLKRKPGAFILGDAGAVELLRAAVG
jgi:myo-inositol-1(or 4)-monophosphatase